ncbi:Molecular chaperone DnaK (HSP70) [Desulfatibacillum alkenivorans DSM 16219]|jgi:molecular chaperone DnaK (HSP70)|uniref:Molecular chaperone DnaK (HSP70) n=1 Tax=Desulfatibacillum alkenivorans DSM 16219 TaxID=1121393 RepID=A0A1M6PUP7_9BACT|nr:Hsp70 family protein [Desulfatibacillum alkenivorans]SHK11570.1 Molecular chaperone DnaK (HSP70) [Desulfatibacillum alkenivorans DSM 16219]
MGTQMKRIYGIDLGTTYSSIAYVDEFGKAVVIPNSENERVTPSVVFFDGDAVVVGGVAKESARLYPNEVVSFIKRSMGEPNFLFEYNGKSYRPEEISAYVLKKVAKDAEEKIGEAITDVVITCPAYFGINEREATKIAGEIAGFNVRQIINEPTAAAIAYGSIEQTDNRVVLVYDLGGGTFDITMIDIRPDAIQVICTGGDHNLGGKDWDDRIVNNLVQEFQTQTGSQEDILEDPDTWQDLQLSAEKSKKILSQREKTPIAVTHGGERVKVELQRDKFYEITRDLLERTISLTHGILEEARKKGYNRFDEIILVGGSTRMPQVEQRIKEEFGMDPKVFDPDEAVAKGAAIFGWKLSINDDLIKRVAQKTQKTVEEITKTMDTSSQQFKDAAREMADDTGVTQAAVESSLIKIRDVTSKSFGVVVNNAENEEAVFNVILRNTAVPVNAKDTFFTAVANQQKVLIRIMECETSEEWVPVETAVEIGTAVLNLPTGLPTETPVEISFSLNREGRLQITARETTESKEVNVVIETTSVIRGKDLDEAKARSQGAVVQ